MSDFEKAWAEFKALLLPVVERHLRWTPFVSGSALIGAMVVIALTEPQTLDRVWAEITCVALALLVMRLAWLIRKGPKR